MYYASTAAAAYIKRKFHTGECRRMRDFFPSVHKGTVVAHDKSQKELQAVNFFIVRGANSADADDLGTELARDNI